jgi:hypothetical protein
MLMRKQSLKSRKFKKLLSVTMYGNLFLSYIKFLSRFKYKV